VFSKHARKVLVLLALVAVVAAACGDDDDDTTAESAAGGSTTTAAATADTGAATETTAEITPVTGDCIGTPGCIPDGQPDVNGDGTVKIGVLSPGDTHDNGYYQSFVDTAQQFSDENGWDLIVVDQINPSDALEQARNMCRQGVDMVAVAAGELADAIPASEEDVCAGTVWYVAGGAGVEQTPYFVQTNDDVFESLYVIGYASGLVMQQNGLTKAGFVTGPELDFATNAYNAWTAGIQAVIPDAETVVTYTGDFDDSAVGVEGAQAQLDQGVQFMYSYLGGATDAVADLAHAAGVQSVTPRTDRCDNSEDYDVSGIFSPGAFFAGILEDFNAGTVELGITRTFHIGVDPVPTVKVCDSVTGAAAIQTQVDDIASQVGAGTIDTHAAAAAVAGG